MSDTVSITADEARRFAVALKAAGITAARSDMVVIKALLERLDPKPPTLREQVAKALRDLDGELNHFDSLRAADYALAVVRDAVAALPWRYPYPGGVYEVVKRNTVLDLLDEHTRGRS